MIAILYQSIAGWYFENSSEKSEQVGVVETNIYSQKMMAALAGGCSKTRAEGRVRRLMTLRYQG